MKLVNSLLSRVAITWAQNDPEHRETQIDIGISHFKEKMVGYARQYKLDGKLDSICLMVTDVRHQGRARSPTIVTALRSSKPLQALLAIGEPKYHERLVTLKKEIKKLTDEGTLGTHIYNLEQKDFVSN